MASNAVALFSELAARVTNSLRHPSALRTGGGTLAAFCSDKSTSEVLDLMREIGADLRALEDELREASRDRAEAIAQRTARRAADRQSSNYPETFQDILDEHGKRLTATMDPLRKKYGDDSLEPLERRIATRFRVVARVLGDRYQREAVPKELAALKKKLGIAAVVRADAQEAVAREQKRQRTLGPAGAYAEDKLPALHAAAQAAGDELERLRRELWLNWGVELDAV